jgi:uncharacterized Rossmann fold enzyme
MLYADLVKELGIDVSRDIEACVTLASMGNLSSPEKAFSAVHRGSDFAVIGPDDPRMDIPEVAGCRYVMVADSAITVYLMRSGRIPDFIVTDLDGNMAQILECNARGTNAIIHAHGDNIPLVKRYLPLFRGTVVGSCQVVEHPAGIIAPGGFTDGDRAAYIANMLGASSILLTGFSFISPVYKQGSDPSRKGTKLKWAQRYLQDLAMIRGNEMISGPLFRI